MPSGSEGRVLKIASWNVNSIRETRSPDILLLQELKGLDFPAQEFRAIGYESTAVTQKTYNGVAVLSRTPMETVCTTLKGDDQDSHARFLETRLDVAGRSIRVVNL